MLVTPSYNHSSRVITTLRKPQTDMAESQSKVDESYTMLASTQTYAVYCILRCYNTHRFDQASSAPLLSS